MLILLQQDLITKYTSVQTDSNPCVVILAVFQLVRSDILTYDSALLLQLEYQIG
jgi:hypothetical protein